MGSLKAKRSFGRECHSNRCGSMQVNELEANRSIRAQELSVVRWSNVDIVPASGPKKIIGA